MYTLKTTRYTFEAPLVLGALLAGAEADALAELSRLIEPVGLAFQIQNDLVEYQKFKGVNRLQQTDLLEGKKTLLLRTAYDQLGDLDRSFLQLCLGTSTSNDTSVNKIEQLIDKSGAVALLTTRMNELFRTAEADVAGSPLTADQKTGFRDLISQIWKQSQHTGAD